jgi:hypothetical protein
MRKTLICLVILLIATPAYAASTTIILSGSDTISLHDVASEATAAYTFLSNNGTGAVLLVNDFGATNPSYGGGGFGAFTSVNSLAGVTLGNFAGIMFASPGSCCSDPGGFAVGHEADLAAFVAAHGNLYVEDYLGAPSFASTWNSILGFDGLPGVRADTGCTGDPGVPTAQGLTFGYVGGTFGCYTHQIYDPAVFAPLGFVSLVDGCNSERTICGSVILGSGEAAVGVTPEPATLVLFGTGLVTVLVRGRKALKRTQ